MKQNYKPGKERDVNKELIKSLSPNDKVKLTENGYNITADDWDKTRQNLWPELMAEIAKYIKKENKILDLGCGNGRLISEIEKLNLQNYNLKYTGIDPSLSLIKIAKDKHKNYANDLFKFNGFDLNNKIDPGNINFENEKFDQIISIAVLHHIPQEIILNWLSECYRVLKRDTISIWTTWNLAESNYDLDQNGEAVIGFMNYQNTRFVKHYDYQNIKNIFEKSGFEIIEIKEVKRESGMSNTLIVVRK